MTEPEAGFEPVPPPAPPPRDPFWGYGDLFLFAGLTVPSLMTGALLVKLFLWVFQVPAANPVFEMLPAQFLGYGVLFSMLWVLFRFHYGRPFWDSLGWRAMPLPAAGRAVLMGGLLAVGVALASVLLQTPDINSPMKEFLTRRSAVILLAVFGTTLGPLFEELAFRGFMQPLFVRSLGAIPGVLLAAVPFGLLHLQQYGWSWRHGLLISAAGAAFGWMRHVSGSTKASVIMHMAYNSMFFLTLVAQRKDLPSQW